MTTPNENTASPAEARRALEESQARGRRTAGVIAEASRAFGAIIDHGERNHYTEKARTIMRGAH